MQNSLGKTSWTFNPLGNLTNMEIGKCPIGIQCGHIWLMPNPHGNMDSLQDSDIHLTTLQNKAKSFGNVAKSPGNEFETLSFSLFRSNQISYFNVELLWVAICQQSHNHRDMKLWTPEKRSIWLQSKALISMLSQEGKGM